jgi:nucleoside-diphosphate-sugar epimerase
VSTLILLGCGYTLTRLALEEAHQGRRVLAVTGNAERRAELERAGVQLLPLEEALSASEGAHVVISIPPEAGLDAMLAESLGRAMPARLVYLCSTGVYGASRGVVDEDTPVDPSTPSAKGRLQAESTYRPLGGISLRIAGIYGPGRGLHERLLAGTLRLPESGGGRISRVHVNDLVQAIQVALERGEPGACYCVADDRPSTQLETAIWLCEQLRLPLPPMVPLASLHETLRGDRAVQNARLKALGWQPRYPDYKAGFSALLAER